MKRLVRIGIGILLSVLPAWHSGLADSFEAAELQHKAEEITVLRGVVADKIERGVTMRRALADRMKELTDEIRIQKDRWRIESYRSAVGNPRIAFDLQLVQQLQAYIGRLDERIAYFREAGDVLDFHFRQINDDLMMIRTLDDFAVDQLIGRINHALDEYVPATQKKLVGLDNLRLRDGEVIWEEIARAACGGR